MDWLLWSEVLFRAAAVLERLGETVKANNLRQPLQTKFPNYQLEAQCHFRYQ